MTMVILDSEEALIVDKGLVSFSLSVTWISSHFPMLDECWGLIHEKNHFLKWQRLPLCYPDEF
jgi:hypothetical protein